MARQEKKSYDLSEAEQRDLVTLIQQGKPLPEKYRFILFEDKREVELVWNGKTRDVCTTVLPFQTLEHIDEPRTETKTQSRPVRQPWPPATRLDNPCRGVWNLVMNPADYQHSSARFYLTGEQGVYPVLHCGELEDIDLTREVVGGK